MTASKRSNDKIEGQPTEPTTRSKLARTSGIPPQEVVVRIQPGSASPNQKARWCRFWAKLISECKREATK